MKPPRRKLLPHPRLLSQQELDDFTTKLVTALKTVYDPEIPVDIYELGLIYKVDVADNKDVTVDMTLTAPNCPVAGEMPAERQGGAATGGRHRRSHGQHDVRSALDAGAHERRSQTRTEYVLMETPEKTSSLKTPPCHL